MTPDALAGPAHLLRARHLIDRDHAEPAPGSPAPPPGRAGAQKRQHRPGRTVVAMTVTVSAMFAPVHDPDPARYRDALGLEEDRP